MQRESQDEEGIAAEETVRQEVRRLGRSLFTLSTGGGASDGEADAEGADDNDSDDTPVSTSTSGRNPLSVDTRSGVRGNNFPVMVNRQRLYHRSCFMEARCLFAG